MITAPPRPQPLQDQTKQEQMKETASVKTRGHLALLEWEERPVPIAAPLAETPIYRRTSDRWYTGGTLLLFVTTIAALAASLCR